MVTADQMYDDMKEALRIFQISWHQKDQVTVHFQMDRRSVVVTYIYNNICVNFTYK